jgi:hypothetical protein
MSSSSSFVLKQLVQFQEGEHYWLLPMTHSSIAAKLQTVCFQEGENDVGMTRMDTTIHEEHMVSLFLCIFSNFDNKLLPKEIILIRNNKKSLRSVWREIWRRRILAQASKPSRRPTKS